MFFGSTRAYILQGEAGSVEERMVTRTSFHFFSFNYAIFSARGAVQERRGAPRMAASTTDGDDLQRHPIGCDLFLFFKSRFKCVYFYVLVLSEIFTFP